MRSIISLSMERRGVHISTKTIGNSRIMMTFKLPLNEIAVDFYDTLKSISSGYASFDYEENGFESSDIVKVTTIDVATRFRKIYLTFFCVYIQQLNIKLNGILVEELSTAVHASKAVQRGKEMCLRLKETIPQQLYEVAIQVKLPFISMIVVVLYLISNSEKGYCRKWQ